MRKTPRNLSEEKNNGETVVKGSYFRAFSKNKEKNKTFHEEGRKINNFTTNKVKNYFKNEKFNKIQIKLIKFNKIHIKFNKIQ